MVLNPPGDNVDDITQVEDLQLSYSGEDSVTELKVDAQPRHRYQLFAESMKMAGELLY